MTTLTYKRVFKIGDVAITKNRVIFTDRSQHLAGEEIVVNELNIHYFNFNYDLYTKKTPTEET